MTRKSEGTKGTITAREITCEKVVRALCERLEKGVNPWVKPWGPDGQPRNDALHFAVNLFTGRPYGGINQAMLEPGYYVTPRQAREHGGRVLAGKGQDAVFYKDGLASLKEPEATAARELLGKFMDRAQRVEVKGRPGWKFSPDLSTVYVVLDDGKAYKQVPILRDYRVWNVRDTEGLEEYVPAAPKSRGKEPDGLPRGEGFVEAYRKGSGLAGFFNDGGDSAYYRPGDDTVHLPAKSSFKTLNGYYSTAFHEMTHSTGHSSRLRRKGVCGASYFGSRSYSEEELVAEIGAAMCMGYLGISTEGTESNSAAYLASWAAHIRGDKSLAEKVTIASAQARKAFAYMAAMYEAAEGEERAKAAGSEGKGRAKVDLGSGKIVIVPASGRGGIPAALLERLRRIRDMVAASIAKAAEEGGSGKDEAARVGIVAGAMAAMYLAPGDAAMREIERDTADLVRGSGTPEEWQDALAKAWEMRERAVSLALSEGGGPRKAEAVPDFALLREGSRYALADLRDPMGAVEFADEEESLGAPEETIVLPCGARLAVYAGKVGSAETCGYRQALELCDRAYRERARLGE